MQKTVAITNGSDEQKTIAALKRAAGNASGKARKVIQGLAKALTTNPAARGRNTKGATSMAKKTHHKATARRRTATNPTPRKARKHYRRRTASNPTRGGFASTFKSLNLTQILTEGAAVASGGLVNGFAARQAERLLPSLHPALRTGLSTAIVAGALGYFGRGKGFARNMAVGAASHGITAIVSSFLPGLVGDGTSTVAGLDGWAPDGTWNPELGGIYYGADEEPPVIRNF